MNGGMVPTPPSVAVGQDFTFTLKGLMGEFLRRRQFGPGLIPEGLCRDPGAKTSPTRRIEPKQGDRITIVMTTQASTLEGTVTDDTGGPVNSGNLLLFSEDKTMWRTNSVHTHRGGVDVTGHFQMQEASFLAATS